MSLELIEQMVRAANPVPDVRMLGESPDQAARFPEDTGTEIEELFVDVPSSGVSPEEPAGARNPRRRWMLVAA